MKVIAVDFDGTICKHSYQDIGEPNWKVIKWLKARKIAGDKLILWTCREGEHLEDAVLHCKAVWNLEFDAVNENIPELRHEGFANHKVCADIYLDDKALNVEDIIKGEK